MYAAMPANNPFQPAVALGLEPAQRTWAILTHASNAASMLGFPFPVVPGLIMWAIKRHESPYLDDVGKEVMNFQITIAIYSIVSGFLLIVGIGFILLPAVFLLAVIGTILGMIAANQGRYFRYPMCLRIIK